MIDDYLKEGKIDSENALQIQRSHFFSTKRDINESDFALRKGIINFEEYNNQLTKYFMQVNQYQGLIEGMYEDFENIRLYEEWFESDTKECYEIQLKEDAKKSYYQHLFLKHRSYKKFSIEAYGEIDKKRLYYDFFMYINREYQEYDEDNIQQIYLKYVKFLKTELQIPNEKKDKIKKFKITLEEIDFRLPHSIKTQF